MESLKKTLHLSLAFCHPLIATGCMGSMAYRWMARERSNNSTRCHWTFCFSVIPAIFRTIFAMPGISGRCDSNEPVPRRHPIRLRCTEIRQHTLAIPDLNGRGCPIDADRPILKDRPISLSSRVLIPNAEYCRSRAASKTSPTTGRTPPNPTRATRHQGHPATDDASWRSLSICATGPDLIPSSRSHNLASNYTSQP